MCEDSRGVSGTPRMHADLDEGACVSLNGIARLLAANGLQDWAPQAVQLWLPNDSSNGYPQSSGARLYSTGTRASVGAEFGVELPGRSGSFQPFLNRPWKWDRTRYDEKSLNHADLQCFFHRYIATSWVQAFLFSP